ISILLGFGSLLPLSENLFSERYQGIDVRQTLTEYEGALEATGLEAESIGSFLQDKNVAVILGRALFPRHYSINEGHTYFYPNLPLGFPRMTFNLIGPEGQQGIILPGDVPAYFPHASDVVVIGCREQDHIDALAVIILDETHAVYTRFPKSELQCPLKQPVCDNDSVCK
ncbi:MAG TPA: hypothetical protein VLT51_17375, partial [Anaerolineales bacterium]|nr:hypothetical protein [Anaerolineales bacterium]